MSLKPVQRDDDAPVDDLPDVLGDLAGLVVDPSTADLDMEEGFRDRVLANQRIGFVREANMVRWNIHANQVLNPAKAKELTQAFQALRTAIAALDMKYPHLKALSMEMMRYAAQNENEEMRRGG